MHQDGIELRQVKCAVQRVRAFEALGGLHRLLGSAEQYTRERGPAVHIGRVGVIRWRLGTLRDLSPLTRPVETRGERIKSPQTGFLITLPGRQVATVQVQALFGDNETNEGSVATVTSGSLAGLRAEDLVVISRE